MTLMLFSGSGSARAATLIVSNQMKTRGNVPVFVTCHGSTPKLVKSVPLGQESVIEIPPNAGDVTDLSQGTSCIGTFYGEALFMPTQMMYALYNHKVFTECENACLVAVKDDGFYRWNYGKESLDKIPPFYFIQ